MAVADAAHCPDPAPTFRSAAASCAAMLNSGSLDFFVLPSIVVLLRMLTAYLQAVAAPRTFGSMTSSPSVSGWPPLAIFSKVWSSVGFWPPPVQDDQFFQYPIVSAIPPGGGELLMLNSLS